MVPAAITLRDDVKEEGLDIVVKRLVVEEHLGEQTEVLAVDLVLTAVHLIDADVAVPVNLVAWRVSHLALEPMTLRHESTLHVLETVLADPKASIWDHAVLFRIRSLIPGVDIELAKADALDRRGGAGLSTGGGCGDLNLRGCKRGRPWCARW